MPTLIAACLQLEVGSCKDMVESTLLSLDCKLPPVVYGALFSLGVVNPYLLLLMTMFNENRRELRVSPKRCIGRKVDIEKLKRMTAASYIVCSLEERFTISS